MVLSSSPRVDLVVVFRAASKEVLKQKAKEDALEAQNEYSKLLATLTNAGLQVVGKRGENAGQLLLLIRAPNTKLSELALQERQSHFLRGLPASQLSHIARIGTPKSPVLSPADRIRLVHEYVTATPADHGLGIIPQSTAWPHVVSVMALHDDEFNHLWIRLWTRRQLSFGVGIKELDKIKEQFGESVALYFSFLSAYTNSLFYIALAGIAFYFLKIPYSALYSFILVSWSVFFVEYWRLRERLLSIRWGTRGHYLVEKKRADYTGTIGSTKFPWWRRDVRILASLPVIILFALFLAAALTGIFVFEAFVSHLYRGPGQQYISFAPTVIFIALVPRILELYHSYAVRLTQWENHSRQSGYDASLTIKTFALSAIVAYLGLALSAFIYVPFGEVFMTFVHSQLHWFTGKGSDGSVSTSQYWESSHEHALKGINSARLQNQMFAFTVTNQIINAATEVVLPFVMRKVDEMRSGKSTLGSKKKRVVFDDEDNGAKEEREYLESVRKEVALPEYSIFVDYSEMITQFGYVALWSTIWPLAPVMALLNNWLELRSDAFKITQHVRRPLPTRTDTIGPWLECMGSIAWLSAITNAALVFLFKPRDAHTLSTELKHEHPHMALAPEYNLPTANLIVPAIVIALASSHGYLLARRIVRHVLERMYWEGSEEKLRSERAEKEVKEQYLRSLGVLGASTSKRDEASNQEEDEKEQWKGFWEKDEGSDEIERSVNLKQT